MAVPAHGPIPTDTRIYKLLLHAKSTLGTQGLRESVALPPGNDKDEWVAAQILGLYEELYAVVAAIGSFCECREMDIGLKQPDGRKLMVKWREASGLSKDCTAREYMRKVLAYVHEELSDRDTFPLDGSAFPERATAVSKQMLKKMFRVYAHAYLFHFDEVKEEKMGAHLNFCYKHFLYFVKEFNLVDDQELAPLRALNEEWLGAPPEPVPSEARPAGPAEPCT